MSCSYLRFRNPAVGSIGWAPARLLLLLAGLFIGLTVNARSSRPPLEVPERDETELKLIKSASAISSTEQLRQEIERMTKALHAGLDDDDKDDVARTLKAFGGNQVALNNAAAIAWVQNCPGTALLLAAEAARIDVKNTNAVNTLAALLVQAGYVHKGIPLLEHLETLFPQDPTILNNLGQAWFDVGEKEKAKKFLGRCLALAPAHGAANASSGVIAQSEGKTAEATAHFKAAAEATSSPAAIYELDRSDTHFATPPGFLRLVRFHEYFNPYHYIPPATQKNLDEAEAKEAEVKAFGELISKQLNDVTKLAGQFALVGQQAMIQQMMMGGAKSGGAQFDYSHLDSKRLEQPLHDVVDRCGRATKEFEKLLSDFAFLTASARSREQALDHAWQEKYGDKIGEGNDPAEAEAALKSVCEQKKGIAQECLDMMSTRYVTFSDQTLPPLRAAVNDALNCLPFALPAPMVGSQFYGTIAQYFQVVALVNGSLPIMGPPCNNLPKAKGSALNDDLPSPDDCPLSIKINLVVAKIKADCKSLGFEFEAGLAFKAKKDFRSGETSLTAGVGADIGAASVNGGFVVCWNKDNNLSYLGMQVGASAGISGIPGLSGTADTSSVASGTSVTASKGGLTPDVVKVDASSSVGVTIGPNGVEPQVNGSAAADVMGRNLFGTKL